MRRWLAGSFLLMGVSFTTLQALMIRELLVSFSGNELLIGFILGAWLAWEALGSGLAGRFAPSISPRPSSYAWLQCSLALLLYPSFWIALRAPTLVGAVRGQVVAPLPALLASLLVLLPLAFVDGVMFAVACRVHGARRDDGLAPSSWVYVLEALGSIVGGLALTTVFLPLLSSTQILLLLGVLNVALALPLFWTDPRRQIAGSVAASMLTLLGVLTLLTPLASSLHQAALAGRWGSYELAYEANSDYGNVAVTRELDQVTVWANGTPILTAPDPDLAAAEQLVHLPALFLQEMPRRVLLIGGGVGGVLQQLSRYSLERVDYAEMDPLLIRAVQQVPTPLTVEELSLQPLRLALEDGRRFVRRQLQSSAGSAQPGYDLILLNLPYPSTLVLNRLVTQEHLEMLRSLLAPRGVLAFPAPPARTYAGPALRNLLACFDRTLRTVFPRVRALPLDGLTLWVASNDASLDRSAEELADRWAERGLTAQSLNEEMLRYLLDEQLAGEFLSLLQQGPPVQLNQDRYPAGLRYGLAYESALRAPGWTALFGLLERIRWEQLALAIAALTLVGLVLLRRRDRVLPLALATTGTLGMAADLLILFTFQSLYGYLYRQVGLLLAAFMAGLSLGGLVMGRWARRLRRPWRAMVWLEAAVAAGGLCLTGLFVLLLQRPTPTTFVEQGVLLGANVLMGALVGLEFPLANRVLADRFGEGSSAAGFLYAADLLGATVGAVAVSAVLLPTVGLVETALLMALLKVGSALLVGRAGLSGKRRGTRRG